MKFLCLRGNILPYVVFDMGDHFGCGPSTGSGTEIIQYDMFELFEKSRKLFGAFATEDTEDGGYHLELDRFQFTFFKLFSREEPI